MSEVKSAMMTVPRTAYEMQQAQMKKLADKVAQLEKGLPSVPTEVEEQNRALRAKTAALEAELEALKAAKSVPAPEKPKLKITEKGCISIKLSDGWPVFLYPSQLEKLFAMTQDIREFLTEHDSELK